MLVPSNGSVSKNLIKDEFGNRGLEVISKLVTKGIQKEENQTVSIVKERSNFELESVHKLPLNLIEKATILRHLELKQIGLHFNFKALIKKRFAQF